MVEYRKARAEDAADILDFINYVFSQAHRPHDFKKLNPRMYASDYPFWEDHYVAVENGKIRGTLSVTRIERERAGGFDLAELNGLRQRYEYFGYTQGDCRLRARITPTNVRQMFRRRLLPSSGTMPKLLHGIDASKCHLPPIVRLLKSTPWLFQFTSPSFES